MSLDILVKADPLGTATVLGYRYFTVKYKHEVSNTCVLTFIPTSILRLSRIFAICYIVFAAYTY